MKHPIQPIHTDEHGVIRFKANAIVRFLLDNGGYNLNQIACMGFPQEDYEQLMQLIGYSLSGFGDLDCASVDTFETAARMAAGQTESEARIAHLQETLDDVREGLRIIVPQVFRIAPEDLQSWSH